MYVSGNCLSLYLKEDVHQIKGYIPALKAALNNPINQKTDVHIQSSQSTNCLRDIASFAQRLSVGWVDKDHIHMYIKHGTVFPELKQLRIGKNVKNAGFFQRSRFPKLECAQISGRTIDQGLMRTHQLLSLKILCLSDFAINDLQILKTLCQNVSKITGLKRWSISDASFPAKEKLEIKNTCFPSLGQLRIWNVENCCEFLIDAPCLWSLQMNSVFIDINFLNNLPNLSWLETHGENRKILKQKILKNDPTIHYYQ